MSRSSAMDNAYLDTSVNNSSALTNVHNSDVMDQLADLDNTCYMTQTSFDTANVLLYFQIPLALCGILMNLASLLTLAVSHSSPTAFLIKTILCADTVLLIIYLPGRYYKLAPWSHTSAYVAMIMFPELFGLISIKYWLNLSLAIMTYVNICRPLQSLVWNTYKRVYGCIGTALIVSALFNSIGFSQMKMITVVEGHQHFSIVAAKRTFYAYDNALHVFCLYPLTTLVLSIFVANVVADLRRSRRNCFNSDNTPSLQRATVVVLGVFDVTHCLLAVGKVIQLVFHAHNSCDDVTRTSELCDVVIMLHCCSHAVVLFMYSPEFRAKLCVCCGHLQNYNMASRSTDDEGAELMSI